MRTVETASALLIGTELLTGKVRDENLLALANTLRSVGIRLSRANFVPDDFDVLVTELRTLNATTDLVVTSGGVGPTHDDLTMEAVAKAHDKPLVEHPELRRLLEQVYQERLTQAHLRMARVPQGAEVVIARASSWPTVVVEKTWVLPGVPELFRSKLAALRQHVCGPVQFFTHSVYTQLDEGDLKPLLDQVVEQHQHCEVGSYPKWFDDTYRTKITLDASNLELADAALGTLLSLLPGGEPQWVERAES